MWQSLQTIDRQIVQYFYLHRISGADSVLIMLTQNATLISFSLLLLYLIYNKWKQKPAFWVNPLLIAIIIGVSALITNLLKLWIKRPRPCDIDLGIKAVVDNGGYSFPSGHTTEVFALATAVFLLSKNHFFRFLVLLWAVVIAYTRMAFGVHYPFDILGGMLVGSLTAWLGVFFVSAKKHTKGH